MSSRVMYPYGHWRVNRSYGTNGPWVIQWAFKEGLGTRFFKPLPQHRNFPTRRAALVAKRAIKGIWGQQEKGERCGECGGTGEIVNDGPYSLCDDCNGTGMRGSGGREVRG